MSDLIIIGYEDHDTAVRAYEQIIDLNKDHIVELTGLAVVNVDSEGKSHVDTPGHLVKTGAAGGALWGALFGILFLVPVAGAVVGGALGALFGKLGKAGINDSFRKRVHDLLAPGKSAVVIMSAQRTEDKFLDALRPFGGEVLQTSLTHEQERELAAELGAA
ncbi:DUF1269 domain-containing protein [Actinoplanes awajinensis]|uniref:DUF1269 domain-containing protein n=1 Tax=Actinoplanes awajinensis subsp. mycoplanecinus TaxID=135947 RepID=A0A101JKP9_9ACTN|nr:DUF1269 domain-containing protein [Actinoplanes awajinensis]KUL28146.1 hypothetical protein ADL15_32640 [Actinoplanes awajinensis subsp. mycoplanecinus]